MGERTYGSRTVETSNEEKVFFEESGLTKGDLIDYYERIAETLLPHVEDRPLAMQRFPDGIDGEGFYQKQIGDYFPDWIDREEVDVSGGSQTLVVCSDQASLVYLANQAVITPHAWLSRRDKIREPDQLIFDLDPPGDDFDAVRSGAKRVRGLFEEIGLPAHLKTTGSKGLHVVAPLRRGEDFDDVRSFAQDMARLLAARHPDDLTTAARKEKRGGRLYLDVGRNAYGQTAVAPYAVRAKEGAPVATPLEWDELGDSSLDAQAYTVENIFKRLGQREDPWAEMRGRAVSIGGPRKKLGALMEEEGVGADS